MPVGEQHRPTRFGQYWPEADSDTDAQRPSVREATASPATHAYCRQARRLRVQYRGEPALLQASLRELSRRHDKAHPSASTTSRRLQDRHNRFVDDDEAGQSPNTPRAKNVSATQSATTPDREFARAVVDWFANQVSEGINDRLLHYSQRQDLLKTAERLGITRFHANLIIAVVQHEQVRRSAMQVTYLPAVPSKWLRWTVVAVVQSLIIAGAWWVLRGV